MKNTQVEKNEIVEIVKNTKFQHVAIIMDGNRRWAKKKNASICGWT